MALEDYLDTEVAIAVTATAVALSPGARRVLRRGAVYGLAGVLKATDLVTAAARGVAQGVSSQAQSVATGEGRADASEGAAGTSRA